MFKVSIKQTTTKYEIYSKLTTIKKQRKNRSNCNKFNKFSKRYLYERSIEKIIKRDSIFKDIFVQYFIQSEHTLKFNRQKYTLRSVL